MTASAPRRPGIRFVAEPPAIDTLPRMDVAGFVGYATAGPVDLPVAIEDAERLRAVFGPPPELPPLAGSDEPRGGLLEGAVRAFLANGGVRCHVVRAAASPGSARLPLAGCAARRADGRLEPAELEARSPGSGFDGVETGVALDAAALLLGGPALHEPGAVLLSLRAAPGVAIADGDLIRCRTAAGTLHAPARAVRLGAAPLPSGLRVVELTLDLTEATWLVGGGAPVDVSARVVGEPAPVAARVVSPPATPGGRCTLELRGLAGAPPAAGELVLADAAPGAAPGTLALVVEEEGAPASSAADPLTAATVRGAGAWHAPLPSPAPVLDTATRFDRLRLELATRAPRTRLGELGLSRAHGRWIGALPDDAARHGPPPRPGDEEPARAELRADAVAADVPAAGAPLAGATACLPLAVTPSPEPWLPARVGDEPAWRRDGIDAAGPAAMVDARLASARVPALAGAASYERLAAPGAPLRGVHALLALDEATLLAAPDALHARWTRVDAGEPPVPAPEPPPEDRSPGFRACAARTPSAPVLEVVRVTPGGRVELGWSASDAPAAIYVLETGSEPVEGGAWEVVYSGPLRTHAIFAPAGVTYARVRARADGGESVWSNVVAVSFGATGTAILEEPPAGARPGLLAVQRALLRVCAARGDALALLSLPHGAREREARAHVAALRDPAPSTTAPYADVPPLSSGERQALGFGALHHPWVATGGGGRSVPPDGPVAGLMARQARHAGAWRAAAGSPVAGAVALLPALDAGAADRLDAEGVNVLRPTPAGFAALAQSTLDEDPDRRPVNVRRLIALLVRLARMHGPGYVFEPAGPALRRAVQRGFEARLARMHALGAFAGRTPAEAYRVDVFTAEPAALAAHAPAGEHDRLVVELRVAPSRPLRFLLVRLVDEAGRGLRVELA